MRRMTKRASRGLRGVMGLTLAATMAAAAGCRRGDANAEPAGNQSVVIGPENIVVVTEQEIRTGPALSGALAPERIAVDQRAAMRFRIGGPSRGHG